jgi:hypothetical protein
VALVLIDEMTGRDKIIMAVIVPLGEEIFKIFREFTASTTVTPVEEHGRKR